MKINWSVIAEDGLDAIYDYIVQDQPGNAERFTDGLVDSPDQRLTQAASQVAEPSLARCWDNPDDAVYDQL